MAQLRMLGILMPINPVWDLRQARRPHHRRRRRVIVGHSPNRGGEGLCEEADLEEGCRGDIYQEISPAHARVAKSQGCIFCGLRHVKRVGRGSEGAIRSEPGQAIEALAEGLHEDRICFGVCFERAEMGYISFTGHREGIPSVPAGACHPELLYLQLLRKVFSVCCLAIRFGTFAIMVYPIDDTLCNATVAARLSRIGVSGRLSHSPSGLGNRSWNEALPNCAFRHSGLDGEDRSHPARVQMRMGKQSGAGAPWDGYRRQPDESIFAAPESPKNRDLAAKL